MNKRTLDRLQWNSFKSAVMLLPILLLSFSTTSLMGAVEEYFPDAVDQGGGIYKSDWFGQFDANAFPWLMHDNHGWLYLDTEADLYWFYDPTAGWIYTDPELYSQFYSWENESWLYRVPSEDGTDWAWYYGAEDWFVMGEGFSPLTVDSVEAVRFAEQQAAATADEITSVNQYTHGIVNGRWDSTNAGGWTSGLLPGVYWILYEMTGSQDMLFEAKRRTDPIESQKNNTGTHDLHFMVGVPFLAGYLLTGDEDYRDVVVTTAGSLATRYMPETGTIDSWGWGSYASARDTIVDNMMNIELLFWGADQPGGNPEWFEMAVSHADRTAEEFICENGSTTHIIVWNADGSVRSRERSCTVFPDEYIFARGTGWAIYGYAMSYRYTEMDKYLEPFDRMVQFFFENSDNGVPYWSFTSQGVAPNDVTDTSASALLLAGLFEMSQLHPDADKRIEYWNKAVELLALLASPDYLGDGSGNGILYHATNGTNARRDTALIYGDYYFLEAIKRYLAIVGHTI